MNNELISLIPCGSDQRITVADLQVITGYSSRRALCAELEKIRQSGYPVLADQNGIYISFDEENIYRYVQFIEGKAKSMLFTSSMLRKLLNDGRGVKEN